MSDFEPGDFVTYQNGRFIGRIVECDNFNYIRSCDVKLTEHTPAMESNSIPVGYTMRQLEKKFSTFCAKHRSWLRNSMLAISLYDRDMRSSTSNTDRD
jgi:hypothetical protein